MRFGRVRVTAAVLLAVPAVLLPLYGLLSPSNEAKAVAWAGILGFSVAWAGLVLSLSASLRRSTRPSQAEIDEIVQHLRRHSSREAGRMRAQLLGPGRAAANIRFSGDGAGSLDEIGQFFAAAPERRLIVLGPGGAGKTVFLLELVLQLVEISDPTGPGSWSIGKVPLYLNLSTWSPDQSLEQLLVASITLNFGVPRALAEAAVHHGRVVPLLDGLDELDAPGQDPDRAADVVRRINAYLEGRTAAPLIVACRSSVYEDLRITFGVDVHPAREVRLEPLDLDLVRDLITSEFSAPADAHRLREWHRAFGRSVVERDELMTALQTPWQLALAVSYHRDTGDLSHLLPSGARTSPSLMPYLERVQGLLLEAFIPARVQQLGGGRFRSDDVRDWCEVLARNLDSTESIDVESWCPSGLTRIARWWTSLGAGIMVFVVGTFACLINDGLDGLRTDLATLPHVLSPGSGVIISPVERFRAVWLVVVIGIFPLVAALRAHRAEIRSTRSDLRQLSTRAGRRQFVRWLLLGEAVLGLPLGVFWGIGQGMTIGTAQGAVVALAASLPFSLILGLTLGLKPLGDVQLGARDPMRQDLQLCFMVSLVLGLTYGLPCGAAGWIPSGPAWGTLLGMLGGILFCLTVGIAGQASLRRTVVAVLLWRREGVPVRLRHFLDWCCRVGILRLAGGAYQFRQESLRVWIRRPRIAGAGSPVPRATSIGGTSPVP